MLDARAYESFPRWGSWLPSTAPPPVIPPFMAPVVVPPFAPSRHIAPHAVGMNTGSYSEHVPLPPRQSSTTNRAPVIPQAPHSATSAGVQSRPMTPPTTVAAAVNAGPVHPGIICDECDRTIVGVRHKCLDCSGSLSLPRAKRHTLTIECRF
jgi:hypothetical protein